MCEFVAQPDCRTELPGGAPTTRWIRTSTAPRASVTEVTPTPGSTVSPRSGRWADAAQPGPEPRGVWDPRLVSCSFPSASWTSGPKWLSGSAPGVVGPVCVE